MFDLLCVSEPLLYGFGGWIGFCLAFMCSYTRNASVCWGFVHGLLLGWLYVVYWALTGGNK